MDDTGRIISSVISQNMEGLWDAMINQKNQQLTIFENQRQELVTEATTLKERLFNLGATIPEASSTPGFEDAKKLPIAFVGDNLRTVENMVNYSQGEVDSLTQALNDFQQGKALMAELGDTYASLDAVDQYGPDAYQNFQVNQGDEMDSLLTELTPEQRNLYETSPQFKEGFNAANTRDIAIQKNIQSLEIKATTDAIKSARKEEILNNMDRYHGLLDTETHKLTSGLKAQISVGGTSIGMMITSLEAGDIDSYNNYMEQMQDNNNFNLIYDEVNTMLQAFKSGENYPVLNTLSGMYKEFQDMMDLEKTFKEGLPTENAYNSFINNARDGKFNLIDSRFEKAAKEYNYLWTRFNQFNQSGLMPDEGDMINALELFEASEILTSKELAFLSETSGTEVDRMYREGIGQATRAELEATLAGDWDPDELGEYMDVFDEMDIAHQEFIAMGGGDNPPLNDGSNLDLFNYEVSLANDKARFQELDNQASIMETHGYTDSPQYRKIMAEIKTLNRFGGSIDVGEGRVRNEQTRLDREASIREIAKLLNISEDEARKDLEAKEAEERARADRYRDARLQGGF